jgi:peptidoglycan/LPS O-acetylase OafA/YrhL
MMGYVRFFLACLVASSHVGWRIHGLNPGVMAVVGFYMVSGMAMVQIWSHYYQPATETRSFLRVMGAFYGDRILRLWPGYLLMMTLTAVAWSLGLIHSPFLPTRTHFFTWLDNLLIVPMNFFSWDDADHPIFIPPAWSLGAEVQFYMLTPLLFRWPRLGWSLALVISCAVAVLAASGKVNSELWGYRYLPGVLFIFLMGSCFWLWQNGIVGRGLLTMGAALPVAILGVSPLIAHTWELPYNREIVMGLFMAMALILAAPKSRWRGDSFFGDLAYPVFLSHFLAWWLLGSPENVTGLAGFVLLALLMAITLVRVVEHPAAKWRHRFRQFALHS